MKISLATVRINKITPSKSKDSISQMDLDKAAQLLTEVEGIINPPVLLRTGTESYKVIDGHFEYYAALQAKNNKLNAFIIKSEEELPFYQKQIEVFRQPKATTQEPQEKKDKNKTILANAFGVSEKVAKKIENRKLNYREAMSFLKRTHGVGDKIANIIIEYDFDYDRITALDNRLYIGNVRLHAIKMAISDYNNNYLKQK